jgi:all-trans-retinol 13,14-reductase
MRSSDAVVIGAGLGGLICAARLVGEGRRVLVLEKSPHPGGTSYVFRRKGFTFPMGALGFSFPDKVKSFLNEAGLDAEWTFRRNHFEFSSPGFDLVYSRPLAVLGEDLDRLFPEEKAGLADFMSTLKTITRFCGDLEDWHPDFLSGSRKRSSVENRNPDFLEKVHRVRSLSCTPSGPWLDRLIRHPRLRNFLGSMGDAEPQMSMLGLSFMWNIMAEIGIWTPSRGIHGIADALAGAIRARGGEIRLSSAVKRILTTGGRASGVLMEDGETFESRWVISSADYKTTFLDLLGREDAPETHLDFVRRVPYTSSEFCVYLGIDASRVDFGRMRADHVFFRDEIGSGSPPDLEDFQHREIEICLWARDAPGLVPPGGASLLIRVPFPYGHFAVWRSGDKTRNPGYVEAKARLARKLVAAAERLLPGLSRSVEVMDAATPLTYRDWGGRPGGSIAGWTWASGEACDPAGGLLVETPVRNLLAAGLYAAPGLFLGGVPTSMYTGLAAARVVLED